MGRSLDRLPSRIVVSGVVLLVVLPLLPLFVHSISGRWFYPDLTPDELSLRAWRYLVRPRSRVMEATLVSLLIATSVTVLCLVMGVPAGKGLALLPPRPRQLVRLLFIAPVIVPALGVALGLHVVFVRVGLADTLQGVIIAHLLPTLPYMVLGTAGTFLRSGHELEQQARTLGAGPVRAFLLVGVRPALPGIVTGALFVFLISWSQYALTLLVGGGRVLTLPLLLFAFASAGDMAVTAALCIVFVVPAVLLVIVAARTLSGRSAALTGLA